jgi:MFS family permease
MRPFFILGAIFFSYAAISVSYVSWLSWMSDLIPEKIWGRFFGTRNMLCGASGTVALLIFGKLLDRLNGQSYGPLPLGFGLTFLVAAIFGILGLRFLNRISEPEQTASRATVVPLRTLTDHLFKDQNFRRFLFYSFAWSFSVYFAGPFFTVYFLRDLRYSYSFIAALGVIAAFADIMGMQVWGRVSDRVKNKAIVALASWVAIFLPLAWVTVRPQSVIFPVILHVLGGGFWAGINLCTNNLLLRISPKQNRPVFLSLFNMVTGLGAAGGPILGGMVLTTIAQSEFGFLSWNLLPIQVVFIVSTLLRLLSFQILRTVHEPEEVSVGKVIRILRSLRGMNLASGFNMALHPFVEVEKGGQGKG